jgi:hypothetical protein
MFSQNITIENLTNGEYIALGAIEITSTPHVSIIGSGQDDVALIIERYKSEMNSLLSELFQTFKTLSLSNGILKDISLELLWKSTKAYNQPYNADVTLFVIVRAIDREADSASHIVANMLSVLQSTFNLQKYNYKEIKYDELSRIVSQINDTNIRAIVKEERVENLQNQILPSCYSYDRIPCSNNDFSKIVNAMIDYPNCAISFQLIPTFLESYEIEEIDRMAQMLETLSKGVTEQGVGNISFTLAEKRQRSINITQSIKILHFLLLMSLFMEIHPR